MPAFGSNDKIPWKSYYFIIDGKKYFCNKLNDFLYDDIIEMYVELFKNHNEIISKFKLNNKELIEYIKSETKDCITTDISLVIQDYTDNKIVAFLFATEYDTDRCVKPIFKNKIFTKFLEKISAFYENSFNKNIFSLFFGRNIAKIIAQGTKIEYQNKGFGKILRNQFIKRCKEKDYSKIIFHTVNPYMQKIWITDSKFKIKNKEFFKIIDKNNVNTDIQIIMIEGILKNLV